MSGPNPRANVRANVREVASSQVYVSAKSRARGLCSVSTTDVWQYGVQMPEPAFDFTLKDDFNQVYDLPDPRPYYAGLAPSDYRMPGVIARCIPKVTAGLPVQHSQPELFCQKTMT